MSPELKPIDKIISSHRGKFPPPWDLMLQCSRTEVFINSSLPARPRWRQNHMLKSSSQMKIGRKWQFNIALLVLIDDKLALVWIISWCQIVNKPLSEPVHAQFTEAEWYIRGRQRGVKIMCDLWLICGLCVKVAEVIRCFTWIHNIHCKHNTLSDIYQ